MFLQNQRPECSKRALPGHFWSKSAQNPRFQASRALEKLLTPCFAALCGSGALFLRGTLKICISRPFLERICQESAFPALPRSQEAPSPWVCNAFCLKTLVLLFLQNQNLGASRAFWDKSVENPVSKGSEPPVLLRIVASMPCWGQESRASNQHRSNLSPHGIEAKPRQLPCEDHAQRASTSRTQHGSSPSDHQMVQRRTARQFLKCSNRDVPQSSRVKALPGAIMSFQLWRNLEAAEKHAGRQHIWNLQTFSFLSALF